VAGDRYPKFKLGVAGNIMVAQFVTDDIV